MSTTALPAGDLVETAHEDQAPADEPGDELYEGTVRLTVASSGPAKNLLSFLGELRQNTQLRLLRLVASQRSESINPSGVIAAEELVSVSVGLPPVLMDSYNSTRGFASQELLMLLIT